MTTQFAPMHQWSWRITYQPKDDHGRAVYTLHFKDAAIGYVETYPEDENGSYRAFGAWICDAEEDRYIGRYESLSDAIDDIKYIGPELADPKGTDA